MQPSGAPQQFNEFASWRGEWNAGNTYDKGEAVFHEGSSYICLQFDVIGTEPGTDENVWYLLAQGSAGGGEEGLAAHLADTADAHDASAVSYAGGTGMSATDVEAAIDELATEKSDTSHDHDADYEASGTVATHAAAGDPHTGYRLESADHTHASTGLQAGTIDHGVLTGMSDDDHPQYGKLASENAWAEDQTFSKSFYVQGPRPFIDVVDKYGIVTGGSPTLLEQQNNADFLNQAFSDNLGLNRRLYLGDAAIQIADQSVGVFATGDTSVLMEIFGAGRRNTRIHQRTAGLHALEFTTTGGNLRDIYCHDFMLKGDSGVADYGLHLSKVGYSTFDRLCFWTNAGLLIDTSSFDVDINNPWFLNTSGYSIELRDSTVIINEPVLGEDCGTVFCSGGSLFIHGGYMRDMTENVTVGGINAMGEGAFISRGDGYIDVSDMKIALTNFGGLDNLVNIDNGVAKFSNCRIVVGDSLTKLIVVRTQTAPQYFQFIGNDVLLTDHTSTAAVELVDMFGGTEPHDSIIANNEFMVGNNRDLTIESQFFDPDNNNVWLGNVFRETTGV